MAGSAVFSPPSHPVPLDDNFQWWAYAKGASWRHPLGPESSIVGKERFPVVQVAYEDAVAYSKWAGKRLPTEAEWEFAARGGLTGKVYPWGDDFAEGGQWMANTYQGHFPDHDTGADHFPGVAPVAQFPPNGYGLYDMAGNVWEWVSDWYRPDYYAELAATGTVARNPHGPADSFDPEPPGRQDAGTSRRIISLHGPVLFPLHGRHSRQGGGQHRRQPPRIPLRHSSVTAATSPASSNFFSSALT